jgi:hypothetical protein
MPPKPFPGARDKTLLTHTQAGDLDDFVLLLSWTEGFEILR